MNKFVDGKQCMVVWHVDDQKISHVNPNIVDWVIAFYEEAYETMSVT